MENLINEINKIKETDMANYVVFGGAGKTVKTSADLLIEAISSTNGLKLTDIRIDNLYNSDGGYFIRFRIERYRGWLFGAWVIDKLNNEDIFIHLFGSPIELFKTSFSKQFTPWTASFCASMSIERDELCKSLCSLCVVNRFVDYLKIIEKSGIFTDWIFNKIVVISWDKWDFAHEHGIFWYSVKNYFKKLFSWVKKEKSKPQKELLLD